MKVKKRWIACFMLPGLILFITVFGVSLVVLTGSSFANWSIGKPITFAGIENYIHLMTSDRAFRKAFSNTIIWILLQSTVHVAIGTTVALILSQKRFYWKFVRTVYMIPNIISSAALGMMFGILFNAQFGVVNKVIQVITGNPEFFKNWFYEKNSAFWTVTAIWLPYAATVTILILAEIAAIDQSLIEAARVDGASGRQINRYIVIPLLRNIIGTCAILGGTSMLQKLDILMMTTKGGPLNATLNLPLYIYQTALTDNNFALANTAGIYLIGLGLILVLTLNRVFRLGKSD